MLGEDGKQDVVRLSYAGKIGRFPGRRRWRALLSMRGPICGMVIRPSSTASYRQGEEIIAGFESKGWGRRRSEKYLLSGILVCGHCRQKMFACTPPGRPRCYRCSSNAEFGKGTCGTYEIAADWIENRVAEEVDLGVKELTACLNEPPDELTKPR